MTQGNLEISGTGSLELMGGTFSGYASPVVNLTLNGNHWFCEGDDAAGAIAAGWKNTGVPSFTPGIAQKYVKITFTDPTGGSGGTSASPTKTVIDDWIKIANGSSPLTGLTVTDTNDKRKRKGTGSSKQRNRSKRQRACNTTDGVQDYGDLRG